MSKWILAMMKGMRWRCCAMNMLAERGFTN